MAGSEFKEIYGKGPRQVEDGLVSAAILPGTFVVKGTGSNADKFVAAGTANDNGDIMVLDKMAMRGQGVDDVYVANDPGKAFRCITGCTLQVRAAAGTFTMGDAVSVNSSGQVVAASGTGEILGYVETTKTVADMPGPNNVPAVSNNTNLVYVTFTNRPNNG